MKILSISFITASLLSTISAFEVNTHQAMTRCATTTECKTEGSQNLVDFAKDALLQNSDYSNEQFEGYNASYFNYASNGTGFTNWHVTISTTDYLGLIEAGSVLEDAVYTDSSFDGDGRFNNHFYSSQFNSQDGCGESKALMKTTHTLCVGFGQRTDSISWTLDDTIELGNNRKNDYSLEDAFGYFRNAFIGSEQTRKANQAKLFVSIGFMSHMMQDLHSPAHVRDNSHPFGDYLEIYGRYNGGFNLRDGKFHANNNPLIVKAIEDFDMKKWMLQENSYSSYEDIFTHEAHWISHNFFSASHGDTTFNDNDLDHITGEGLDYDTSTDFDSIFDDKNLHLARSETQNSAIPNIEGNRWFYINTLGNAASEKGDITHKTVAILEDGILFNSDKMIAVVDETKNPNYSDYDATPLEQTSLNVIPRAVGATQAFINYFFRAKMEASLNNDTLTLKNVSDSQWVANANLLTFKQGATITLLYIDNAGVSREFFSTTLAQDVKANETIMINGISSALQNITLGAEQKNNCTS